MAGIDAARIPFDRAEWLPLVQLLLLELDCLPDGHGNHRAFFMHGVPNQRAGEQIAKALGIEDMTVSSRMAEAAMAIPRPNTIPPPSMAVPSPILITSATWVRARLALFLETSVELDGVHRYFAMPHIPDEAAARHILDMINLGAVDLRTDLSRSSYEITTDLHVSGCSETEISSRTGLTRPIVQANIHAFRSRVHKGFQKP